MNKADLLRARQLSKDLASYGKVKITAPVKPKKGMAFPYKALQITPPDTNAIVRAAAKDAAKAAENAALMAEAIPALIERVEKAELMSRSAASSAAQSASQAELTAKNVTPVVNEKVIETKIIEKAAEIQDFALTPDLVKQIVQMMHKLPEKDKLEVSKGIRNAQSFIYKGTKYGMEEMMHGGSSSSSSSGGYQQPTAGAVDGSNQVFTWTTAPSVIVVDQGRPMQKISSDGSVNWTGTTVTTLTIAPTFDIYGL